MSVSISFSCNIEFCKYFAICFGTVLHDGKCFESDSLADKSGGSPPQAISVIDHFILISITIMRITGTH